MSWAVNHHKFLFLSVSSWEVILLNYWQIEGANPPVIVNVFEIDIDVHVDDSAVVSFLQLFAGWMS